MPTRHTVDREDDETASAADGVVHSGVPENRSGSARVRAWNWRRNSTGMFDTEATDTTAVVVGALAGVVAFVGLVSAVDPETLATDFVSPFWTLVVPFLLVTPLPAAVAAVVSVRRATTDAPVNAGTDGSVAAGLYALVAPFVLVVLAVGDVTLFGGPGRTPMVGGFLLLLLLPLAVFAGGVVGAAVATLSS